METPNAVPKSDAKMYWLVFLAVMSGVGGAGLGWGLGFEDGRWLEIKSHVCATVWPYTPQHSTAPHLIAQHDPPAMLLSRTNDRLNTLRVLPPAIQLSPLTMLAQLPSMRKALGTIMVMISIPLGWGWGWGS